MEHDRKLHGQFMGIVISAYSDEELEALVNDVCWPDGKGFLWRE